MSTVDKTKKSWWRRLIPSCGKSKSESSNLYRAREAELLDNQSLVFQCGNCRKDNAVLSSASSVFVCVNCARVNRVAHADGNGHRRVSFVAEIDSLGKVELTRTGSTTFSSHAPDHVMTLSPIPERNKFGALVVPQCTVCMDGPGDMVLQPCAHGGICEPCAKHICRNLSVGGCHCPKCRVDIVRIVRLAELHADGRAVGVAVEIPLESVKSGPPKVPPPPGQQKAKSDR